MATRTRTSFQKRQKELARVEKQRDKAAKRLQRKLEGPKPEETDEMLMEAAMMEGGIEGVAAEEGGPPAEPSAPAEAPAHQEESH